MRDAYLFAQKATIHDVIEHQRQKARKALDELSAASVLGRPTDQLAAEFVDRFRLDVPILDKTAIAQLPNEEVDIDVSGDPARAFLNDEPFYMKGAVIRVAVPFKGEAVLFNFGTSSYTSPIPGEIEGDAVVLTHIAENPDVPRVRSEFDSRVTQIENILEMMRGPAEEWNR